MFITDEVIINCFDDHTVPFVGSHSVPLFYLDDGAVCHTRNGCVLWHDNIDTDMIAMTLISEKILTLVECRTQELKSY